MNTITACLITFIFTFILAGCLYCSNAETRSDIGLKLTNIMNSTMLDLVTHGVIEKEKVHEIEDYFHKHIKEEFPYLKISHGVEE